MLNESCDPMLAFAQSVELRISLIVNWIIILLAFPILTYSIYHSLTQRIFHRNTQIQILIHLIALLVHCVGRFVLHTLDLWNYFRPYNSPCDILPNFYRCLILRFLYNAGQAIVSMTPISVTIERCVAVFHKHAYEHCSLSFGVALGALQFFLAAAYLLTKYIHVAFIPNNYTFVYCLTVASSTMTLRETLIPLSCIVILQIISIIVFKLLEARNKRLRAISDINLSTKFTLDQSKRSIIALKSFFYCNCLIMSIIVLAVSFMNVFSSHLTRPRYVAIFELTHALPLYGIIVCLAVWWKLRVMNGEQRRNITMSMRRQSVHADVYFTNFNNQIKI